MYGTCSKDYFDIQYIMKSNIDYEKRFLEIKVEEFDIDEVQHVEESFIYNYIGKGQCILEYVNKVKSVENKIGKYYA